MICKTVETLNEGLKRAFRLTIPAEDIDARVEQEVKRIAPQVRMPGFRPGKVPAEPDPQDARRLAPGRTRSTARFRTASSSCSRSRSSARRCSPRSRSKKDYDAGQGRRGHGRARSAARSADAEDRRPQARAADGRADEEAIDEQSASRRAEEELDRRRRRAMPPRKATSSSWILRARSTASRSTAAPATTCGRARLGPADPRLRGPAGRREGGRRADVNVTFPDDYPADYLKGKAATFDVTVKAVQDRRREQARRRFRQVARPAGPRAATRDLSRPAAAGAQRPDPHAHEAPAARPARRRATISRSGDDGRGRVRADLAAARARSEPRGRIRRPRWPRWRSEAKDYRAIAERRVRLGLLLSEIGAANGVEVSQQEMNQLIMQAAPQYQGKDRERFIEYVQQEPMAAAQLRAPLFEDKVVDFLFSKADISDRTATRAELEARSKPKTAMSMVRAAATTMPRSQEGQGQEGRQGEGRSPQPRPRSRQRAPSKRPRPTSRSRPSR